MTTSCDIGRLSEISKTIRREILELIYRTRSPHIGPSFSIVEVLVALYFKYLNVDPADPSKADRDRLIMSKGHACLTLYTVLKERGFLSADDLKGFAKNGGTLEQHPNRDVSKGIELSTGSLGHGLSVGAGMAFAAKKDGKKQRVFVILGDGELNEGAIWEAVMFASQHKLNNLVSVVDCNGMQALGYTKDIIDLAHLSDTWKSFGWAVREVNGHNLAEVCTSLEGLPFSEDKPNVILARTVKGKGVSFMENKLLWHYRAPDEREYEAAIKELNNA
ncbi:MAG TPA: transketolase [Syntrophorhabdaceae bacterium]